MKLLLDTHIWIWSVASPERLSKRVAAALESSKNDLWLSPISVWELLLLAEKRSIALDRSAEEWIAAAFAASPVRDAPLNRDVAIESRRLQLAHQDPADRFIAATARVYDLTLVTADERLRRVRGLDILPNH